MRIGLQLGYGGDGRFTLGLGASGSQVVEGFHGVPYDAPFGHIREIVEICRQVWSREPMSHQGAYSQIPLRAGEGTGLGKPLNLIDCPVRTRIPISIAALGPRNVALAAEIAEGREPIFFHPDKAAEVRAESVAAGKARRDPALGELDIAVGPSGRLRRKVAAGGVFRRRASPARVVRRRDGCTREELLPRSHVTLWIRKGGAGCPGPLPRRARERCRGSSAGRTHPSCFLDRPTFSRSGTNGCVARRRCHDDQGSAAGPDDAGRLAAVEQLVGLAG
ncbi:LLM class flavin-dependent oxidoreductase [Amycolatopsis acidiphila]|uniref:LLM class flavin-dependent oxidoreductase n=1 Tax=Amycolatopsis acidiphila TaxID=715473 RepID=UPI0035710123